jgi:hypothetical protein
MLGMATKTPRNAETIKKASGPPRPDTARKQHSSVAKKSYSIPLTAAVYAEKLAEFHGISTSALVGRAIEEMYERTQQIAQAREIAQELLAEAVEAQGPVTNEEEAAIDAFLAEVKAADA